MRESNEQTGTLRTLHRETVWTEDGQESELVILRDDNGLTWLMRSLDGPLYRWDPEAAKAAEQDGKFEPVERSSMPMATPSTTSSW